MAIRVVTDEVSMVEPYNALRMEPTAQLLLNLRLGERLIAMRSQQTLRRGEHGSPSIALYRSALQHQVVVAFHCSGKYALGIELPGYAIVFLPSKLFAPSIELKVEQSVGRRFSVHCLPSRQGDGSMVAGPRVVGFHGDRKSTRLNSSHANISYAVFC